MQKSADLLGSDAYPGEEPQAAAEAAQIRQDYSVAPLDRPADEYNWAMSGTHVSVSNDHHVDQFKAMGWNDGSRPHAFGELELHFRWTAFWSIKHSNISLHLVEKRLKRYTKDQGWDWGGLLDQEGMPYGSTALKQASVEGIGEINPGLLNYKLDEWSGTDQFDNPGYPQSPKPFYMNDPDDEMPMTAPRTCSDCGAACINYDDWRKHTLRFHINPDRKPPTDPQPVVDMDDVLPANFNENIMDKTVQRQGRLIFQMTAAKPQPPMLAGPIPYIFDIETDRIYVGHPGERHSDIQGRFTPGGIVEGLYDPKGNVQIRTNTDMPYTVRHMAELWYAMHPELVIKSITLMVGDEKYKLASANIGHKVRNIAATDPAAWAAFQALEPMGNVYAVGGVVRDIVLGKVPKDVDLMVQGVDEDDVQEALEALPGRVDYTGKQFGVFRYRDPEGNEVEIAMPRTERSTGPGHKDFEVYTDPYISVGQDLARRDFTGNAMAVNLSTGDLVDPYRGSEDLKAGLLNTVSDRSFPEDPLRILRGLSSVSRHGLDPSPQTYHDMAAHAPSLSELPRERVMMELDKLMSGADPAKAVDLMETTGILEHVLPDVANTVGFDQKNKHHSLLLNDHIKEVLRLTAQVTDDVDVRWAALLHDIGKPGSQWFDDEGWGHYYENEHGEGQDHEKLGAEMTQRLLTELKFPVDRIQRIEHLVRWHMFPPFQAPNGARKFINRVGDEHADDLLNLRWADSGGKGAAWDGNVPRMQQLVQGVREAGEPTNTKMLAVNGGDLIAAGFKPGPQMGALLNHMVELVLEDPTLNTKDQLLQIAQSTPPESIPQKHANILDPIQEELDPAVFTNADSPSPTVKSTHVAWVKNKVYKILTEAGWPDPKKYLKLVLTGSLTTYQWSADSDFDVSLWIDTDNFPEWVRSDLVALMIEKAEGIIVPGTTHPLQVFVVDTNRFQPDDLYKPGLRSGYDLDNDEWIVLPEKQRTIDVYKTYPAVVRYAKDCEEKVRLLLRFDNAPALKIYWDLLHMKRFRDMREGKGDYSESNIVYKTLANAGLFPHISEAIGEHIA